jgi:hypothetical protein
MEEQPLVIQYTNLLHQYRDPDAEPVKVFVIEHADDEVFVKRVDVMNKVFRLKAALTTVAVLLLSLVLCGTLTAAPLPVERGPKIAFIQPLGRNPYEREWDVCPTLMTADQGEVFMASVGSDRQLDGVSLAVLMGIDQVIVWTHPEATLAQRERVKELAGRACVKGRLEKPINPFPHGEPIPAPKGEGK